MPNYDTSHYDPPAAVAQVTLRDTSSGALLPNVLLLLDTGADITLLRWGGHLATLTSLGTWLKECAKLPHPVPPVRVLDSLLWCDWRGFHKAGPGAFEDWVIGDDENRIEYELKPAGRALERELLKNYPSHT